MINYFKARLKVLPRSHSSVTWFTMANASMWCLPTATYKGWHAGPIGMIKKVIHFNGKNYSFYNNDVTYMSITF